MEVREEEDRPSRQRAQQGKVQSGKAWSRQAGLAGGRHLCKGRRGMMPEREVLLIVKASVLLSGQGKTEQLEEGRPAAV